LLAGIEDEVSSYLLLAHALNSINLPLLHYLGYAFTPSTGELELIGSVVLSHQHEYQVIKVQ
jgi:hypothetical protein